ncbi:MAG: UDP-N-acetylmuramoyl-L-alanyl-D-glutamate-2,6-diaminopimelate ligase [Candidatus Woesebacteria bacterium GW2011_GWA1_39_8]|uniref:UDP-N-acetylmuramoyl-L-alanyl-D-glutamate-2, 6-diaminopimelate ligase n=1 Tax=Candidatus Woesebacteria bacterium GW2011_GWA1_39_8 TaxID=1618552 RepID=A0A0G0PKF4_9BACT|nr:MAG: UDP-N-acetylmuramoyl-L-alanyl-D-glutamate-2,6-diaminopimelate ligase [Candidatus Woesebacteria bacterium GW2011_GWA1_39_8]
MFKENLLDKTLYRIKKLIPKSVFNFFAPYYHAGLAHLGSIFYSNPSKSLKVIGVTGTKGKSTTVYLISKIFESTGMPIAAIGSLGFKIKNKEWPNTLKMTMPGRFKLQKFFYEAKKAGCKYVVLEVTSEGIKQKRHLGINFDCAIFTNLHKEHLESHGSFENYYRAKQELFARTNNIHVLNADDKNVELFSKFSSKRTIFYGIEGGDMKAQNLELKPDGASFEVYGTRFNINFGGRFNVLNCLAALSVAAMYGIDLPKTKPVLEGIKNIPGRMEFVQKEPFGVVVDYAHTPDSLEAVYKTLKKDSHKLICVLGAAGGGRDKWKRPEFGRIAGEYCDEIILTDEDPYEENPEKIIKEVASGIKPGRQVVKILDRKEAIKTALDKAEKGDIVVITGKGSEISMAIAGGKKIPWSDKEIVRELLKFDS